MKLTNDEIQEIAYRLEDVIGHQFHDTIYNILTFEREDYNDEEVSDEDINKIKKQLSKLLWNE